MNKQGQRSMKSTIKMFEDLVWFGIEGQYLGSFFVRKCIKNQGSQNMSMIKAPLLLFYSLMKEKKSEKFGWFWHRKMILKTKIVL